MEDGGNFPWVALVIAALGAGGLGAFISSIVGSISKLRSGVAARESKRKSDIIAAKEDALRREAEQRDRADMAERNVRRLSDYARDLRGILIEDYRAKEKLPRWPTLEDTLSLAEIDHEKQIQEKKE